MDNKTNTTPRNNNENTNAQNATNAAAPESQPVEIRYDGRELYRHEIYRAAFEALANVSDVMSEHHIMDNDDDTFAVTMRQMMQMAIGAAVNAMAALPCPDLDQAEAMADQMRDVRQALAPFGFGRFDQKLDPADDGSYVITFP